MMEIKIRERIMPRVVMEENFFTEHRDGYDNPTSQLRICLQVM